MTGDWDDMDVRDRETWQRRLRNTRVDDESADAIVGMENAVVDEHEEAFDAFADSLIDRHNTRGFVTGEEIVRALKESLDGVSETTEDALLSFMTKMEESARTIARERSGL
jgi:hypothetical protein